MSLTREDLEDIKQIVAAAVHQEVHSEISVVREGISEVRKELGGQISDLREYADKRFSEAEELQNEILNSIGTDLSQNTDDIANHETRITRLEKAAA